MSTGTSRLTVYFEEPFWVGVFERLENGRLSAAKVTFGAEPRDREIYELILRQYHALTFGRRCRQRRKSLPETPSGCSERSNGSCRTAAWGQSPSRP